MLLRALIVLLLAMNLGVALWWVVRPLPGPPPAPEPAAGVPRLQLVSEAATDGAGRRVREPSGADIAATASSADAAGNAAEDVGDGEQAAVIADAADVVDAGDRRCLAFGPYADAQAAARGRERLQPLVLRLQTRDTVAGARGWRVMLPPFPDRGEAQAEVARLAAAGFDDHFIIAQGDEANAIALGRFSAEGAARRHETALRGAGFQARAEPLGGGDAEIWLDVEAAAGFDGEAARAAAGAVRAEALDCARLP